MAGVPGTKNTLCTGYVIRAAQDPHRRKQPDSQCFNQRKHHECTTMRRNRKIRHLSGAGPASGVATTTYLQQDENQKIRHRRPYSTILKLSRLELSTFASTVNHTLEIMCPSNFRFMPTDLNKANSLFPLFRYT
jgi:hypothetical protein